MATFGCIVLMLLGLVVFAAGTIMGMFAHGISTICLDWQERLVIIAILSLGLFLVFLGGYLMPFHLVPV